MLYCDTSALLKLYIEERHSDTLKARVAEADAVAVCRIAWAESAVGWGEVRTPTFGNGGNDVGGPSSPQPAALARIHILTQNFVHTGLPILPRRFEIFHNFNR